MEEVSTTQRDVWKRTAALFAALLCLLSVAPLAIPVVAQPTGVSVYLCDKAALPGSYVWNLTDDPRSSFTLSMYVVNVTNLRGYSGGLSWNASVLNCTDFRYGNVWTLANRIDVSGDTNFSDGVIDPVWGTTGKSTIAGPYNGTLFEADFDVLIDSTTGGETWINVTVTLVDPNLNTIVPDLIQDGFYKLTMYIPPARSAIITMTQTPGSGPGGVYIVGDSVTCTATQTQTAFNDVSQQYGSCDWMLWTVTAPNATFWTFNASSITVTLDVDGTWYVSVVGYASVMLPDYPLLAWSNTVTHPKVVYKKTMGGAIDVFTETRRWCNYQTNKIGLGPNQPADAYMSDEAVTLYANVTYNGDGSAMEGRLVAIEIWGPNENGIFSQILAKTVLTNHTGMANLTFRIPTYPNETACFGKWWVLAKVTVPQCTEEPHEEITVNDTLEFDVGYLLTVADVVVTDPLVKLYTNGTISVKITNIAQIPRNVTVEIVIFDDCMVPVVKKWFVATIPGGVFCQPYTTEWINVTSVFLPKWTYPGMGKVAVSLYTMEPKLCGKPYSPEKDVLFVIDPPPPGWYGWLWP